MKKTAYLIVFSLIIQSCQKKVEFDLKNNAPKMSVNSILQPDSLCKVYISESLSPIDVINFQSITDANIEIWQNKSFLGFLDTYIKPKTNPGIGYYTNPDILIQKSDSFELKISHNDYTSVNAYTEIPTPPTVSSIEMSTYSIDTLPLPGYSLDANIKLTIDDNSTEENYYAVSFFYYADYIDTDYWAGRDSDTLYKKRILFEHNSLSSLQTYMNNDGIIISDELFNGQRKNFSVLIEDYINIRYSDFTQFYIEIKSISKDYYLYQKTLKEYYQSSGNPFSEPITVYNNINNGYGIFAGYNSVIDTVMIN